MSTVIFHAREAGAATALINLLDYFRDAGFKVLLDVSGHAANIFGETRHDDYKRADIVICGFDKPGFDRTGSFLRNYVQDFPSIGLLDSWKGIDRFWFDNGSLRQLSSVIAVPDNLARTYLMDRGMSGDRVVAIGSPALDAIRSVSTMARVSHAEKARVRLGIGLIDPVLVLFSEPLHKTDGYNESLLLARTHMGNLLTEAVEKRYGNQYRLVCRRHPIEMSTIPSGWFDGNLISEIEILSMANLVLGAGSTMLIYASGIGCPVICLDEWLENWVPEWSDIPQALWGSLRNCILKNNKESVTEPSFPQTGSAARVVDLARSLLESKAK